MARVSAMGPCGWRLATGRGHLPTFHTTGTLATSAGQTVW